MSDPTTFSANEIWPIKKLKNWKQNPRYIDQKDFARLKKQITKLGQYKPLLVTKDGTVLGGNMRLRALKDMGQTEAWVSVVNPKNEAEMLEYALSDNDRAGNYDQLKLAELITINAPRLDLELYKVDLGRAKLLKDLKNDYGPAENKGRLAEVFGVPPFSVLDTRQGYWQDRKDQWLELGIQSELGRSEGLLGSDNLVSSINSGTSVFDPVLTELMYKWFNIPGGAILDPFAGGSVRGIVAHSLGYNYLGIELQAKQVKANIAQANQLLADRSKPVWVVGDSNQLDSLVKKELLFDFIFSCPPYADLEVYSKDPGDLSNMGYHDFLKAYEHIISNAMAHLKNDRFAVFIVSEIRDKKTGLCRGFVPATINAFNKADGNLYNEAVLINMPGSVPIRAAKQFNAGRKLGRLHQNVLIFYKGDPKNIKENYPQLGAKLIDE